MHIADIYICIYIYNIQKRAEEEHLDKIYISMFKYIKPQTN